MSDHDIVISPEKWEEYKNKAHAEIARLTEENKELTRIKNIHAENLILEEDENSRLRDALDLAIKANAGNDQSARIEAYKAMNESYEKQSADFINEIVKLKSFAFICYEWTRGIGSIASIADHQVFKDYEKDALASPPKEEKPI